METATAANPATTGSMSGSCTGGSAPVSAKASAASFMSLLAAEICAVLSGASDTGADDAREGVGSAAAEGFFGSSFTAEEDTSVSFGSAGSGTSPAADVDSGTVIGGAAS